MISGLRRDTGGAQGETGGTARSGGANRIGRRSGRRWTVALWSRGARSTTRGCSRNLVDPRGHGRRPCPQPGTRSQRSVPNEKFPGFGPTGTPHPPSSHLLLSISSEEFPLGCVFHFCYKATLMVKDLRKFKIIFANVVTSKKKTKYISDFRSDRSEILEKIVFDVVVNLFTSPRKCGTSCASFYPGTCEGKTDSRTLRSEREWGGNEIFCFSYFSQFEKHFSRIDVLHVSSPRDCNLGRWLLNGVKSLLL